MPLNSQVEIVQNGVVPTVFDLPTGAKPLAVGVTDLNGDQLGGFDESRPSGSTVTAVAISSTGASLVLAANPLRRQYKIYNSTGKKLYVAEQTGASSTGAYSYLVVSNGYYESVKDSYTGIITAILDGGTGSIRVTETF